jgi:hypothetical protein
VASDKVAVLVEPGATPLGYRADVNWYAQPCTDRLVANSFVGEPVALRPCRFLPATE